MGITKVRMFAGLFVAASMLLPTAMSLGAEGSRTPSSQPAARAKVPAGDPYLLDKDIVTGDKLDKNGKPVVIQYEGRELRFSSQASVKAFNAAPAKYLAQIDQEMIKQQLPYYPLDKCVVTNEAIGGMGETINYIYKNRLVRFCCGECKTTFEKDPAKYLAQIDQAVIAKQKDAYPLKTCPISGGTLGEMGKPVDHVAGNRLVRFCCSNCLPQFNKDPLTALAKIDAAGAAGAQPAATPPGSHTSHTGQ